MAITVQGHAILAEITDKGLAELFKFKSEHEGKFVFTPVGIGIQSQQGKPAKYTNVTLAWNTLDGMQTVLKIVEKLHAEH